MCGQRWLLRLLQSSPGMARPVQRIYRLREPLDTSAFLAAFRHLVSSHPALRTRLVETPEGWRQSFPELEAEIPGVAVEGRTRELRAAYARHVFAEDSGQALDLRTEPPFIARILRVDGEHYFSLCLDHIAADDLSTDAFEYELGEAYLREQRKQPHPPTPATRGFFDYLAREAAQSAREQSNLQYWRDQLTGCPLDRSQPDEVRWVPGEAHQWQVSGAAFGRLVGACRARQTSVSAAVLAAYVRLLAELARTDDLVVNVPVSNRTQAADHGLIANLSMLLHLRFKLAGTAPDGRFLLSVRDQVLGAMVHRHYDYDALGELVAADAAARGGRVHWVAGCSYVIERHEHQTPSPLFAERLDNQPASTLDIPQGGFALTCRQNASRLHFTADWDFSVWPSHADQMAARFLEILASLAGTTPLASTATAG
jgi:hypothetical protein